MIFDVFLPGFTKKEITGGPHPESDLSELLAALQAGEMTDTIRTSLEWVLQQLTEAEASAVGAGRHERTETRTAQRNGHRPRLLSTRPAMWSWPSPSCGRGRSSRRC